MGKKKYKEFYQSGYMNNRSYLQHYNHLTELSLSMFDWQNLPKTIDPRFLELCLFSDGMSVFFKDEDMGENGSFLALQCMIGGHLNVYRIPNERRAYAPNGYNKQLDASNSVIIFNNFLHTNSMLDVELFAKRLYNLDRAIDVNANAQKTPILIKCKDSQRLSLENVYMKYEGNVPVIFGTDGLDPDAITVLQTGAPYVADKLYELKTQIWNEALTYLGISNINVVKKERMITDEVTRNQGGTVASRYSRLESRRQACRQINEMFGLDIWVDYREDFQDVEYIENQTVEGEEEDE